MVVVKVIALFCFIAGASACATQPVAGQAPEPASNSAAVVKPKKSLDKIDILKIEHIAPKGRVQDLDYNKLEAVADLIENGKDCIPYLISKLDDETKLDGHVINHWYAVTVGDVALVILSDFSLDSTWQKETIPGMSWNGFARGTCTGDEDAQTCLGLMLERYGRKGIKAKWQAVWDKHKSEIYWNEQERAFALKQ